MKSLLRNWGFPVGLLALWTLVAAYTVHALTGVQPALQSTDLPVMVAPPVEIEAPRPAHAS
jgi:hypothetical protein